MPGLISEIQLAAIDHNVPIDAVLRRMKLCTAKLGLSSLAAWVDLELNGYTSNLPPYRKLSGQPFAWNPYNGWIPILTESAKDMAFISRTPITQSISALRDLLENSNTDELFQYPMSHDLVLQLNSMLEFPSPRMMVKVSRSAIVGILETVRNMALDWSIKMENNGVLGEGMSFESTEKERAKVAMSTYNIGKIGSFVGNLGNENTSRDIIAVSGGVRPIIDTVLKIRNDLPALQQAGVNTGALAESLDALEDEATSPAPRSGKLASLLDDMRSILIGAAGNLAADGALAAIAAATKVVGS